MEGSYPPYPREGGDEGKLLLLAVAAETEYNPSKATLLEEGAYLCSDDYETGYSIVCDVPYESNDVQFEANEQIVGKEKTAPYALAGDKSGVVRGWEPDVGPVKVRCYTSEGDEVVLNLTIGCANGSVTPDISDEESGEAPESKPTDDVSPIDVDQPEPTDDVSPLKEEHPVDSKNSRYYYRH